ncbi:MAG: response regulator [Anaerolineae bacterium]|nr:response regulator [Anaerolineae bacterium]
MCPDTTTSPSQQYQPGDTEVLLIEDDPNDAELFLYALKKHYPAGRVKVVRDGPEALEYLLVTGISAEHEPARRLALILLDIKMPKMDGFEVLARIKSDPRTKIIPVVIFSSSSLERDVATAYKLGANSYVTKPVNFEQFTETVRLLMLYWLKLNVR